MRVSKASIKNGHLVEEEIRDISQGELTSDCWTIQFWGLGKCKECEFSNTDDCGGGETLKRMKENKKD